MCIDIEFFKKLFGHTSSIYDLKDKVMFILCLFFYYNLCECRAVFMIIFRALSGSDWLDSIKIYIFVCLFIHSFIHPPSIRWVFTVLF